MLLDVKNLCFSYYRQPLCLKDINFSLDKNESMLLLGSTGMGKTTLLLVLSGLEDSYFGDVKLNGKDAKGTSDADKNISLLTETPVLLENKTILQNFEYLFSVIGKQKTADELKQILSEFNINRELSTKVKKLSIFEKRKLALARSFIKKPKILMLDDQFSGLDETQCTELIEIYEKLFLSNCSIIFTIGNENYKKRKNILKLLKFDKYFYIYDAKMQKINSLDEFEEKKINIDTIKFLNGKYYNYGTYLEFQDGFINIYFETKFISVEGDVYNRLKEKLSLKTNESEDIILTSCEELNFDSLSLDAFLDKLSCGNIIIYSALDGERLI